MAHLNQFRESSRETQRSNKQCAATPWSRDANVQLVSGQKVTAKMPTSRATPERCHLLCTEPPPSGCADSRHRRMLAMAQTATQPIPRQRGHGTLGLPLSACVTRHQSEHRGRSAGAALDQAGLNQFRHGVT